MAFVSGEAAIVLVVQMSAPGRQDNVFNCSVAGVKLTTECQVPQWFTGLSRIGEKSPLRPIGTSESGVAGFETDQGEQRHFKKICVETIQKKNFKVGL